VNNTCDIERDTASGRHTLPIVIGCERSIRLITALLWLVPILGIALLGVAGLYWAIIHALIGLLICLPQLRMLARGPYNKDNRARMMGSVTVYNVRFLALWAVALIVGGLTHA
jgi:1,4-dihydroxy-2-naphthoate octaprenyltransferase